MNHDKSKNIEAPRVPNLGFSTKWSKDGEEDYRQTVTPFLSQIRETWGNSKSSASISLLLSTTYTAMTQTAKATNKVMNLVISSN